MELRIVSFQPPEPTLTSTTLLDIFFRRELAGLAMENTFHTSRPNLRRVETPTHTYTIDKTLEFPKIYQRRTVPRKHKQYVLLNSSLQEISQRRKRIIFDKENSELAFAKRSGKGAYEIILYMFTTPTTIQTTFDTLFESTKSSLPHHAPEYIII